MVVCFLLNRKLMLNSSSMEGLCLASHVKPKLCRFVMVPWAKPRALLVTHGRCPAVPLLHVLCALPGLRWDRSDGRVLTRQPSAAPRHEAEGSAHSRGCIPTGPQLHSLPAAAPHCLRDAFELNPNTWHLCMALHQGPAKPSSIHFWYCYFWGTGCSQTGFHPVGKTQLQPPPPNRPVRAGSFTSEGCHARLALPSSCSEAHLAAWALFSLPEVHRQGQKPRSHRALCTDTTQL